MKSLQLLFIFMNIITIVLQFREEDDSKYYDDHPNPTDRVEYLERVRNYWYIWQRRMQLHKMISVRLRKYKLYRWRYGLIPYQYEQGYPKNWSTMIENGMRYIMSKTCIKFRPYRPTDAAYLVIAQTDKTGYCEQLEILKYDDGPNVRNFFGHCVEIPALVRRQLSHVIGLRSEQQSHHRDDYINIYFDNILPNALKYFKVKNVTGIADYQIPYDYHSIMHHQTWEWSVDINAKTTMSAKIAGVKLGPINDEYTAEDIFKINTLYEDECSLRWFNETVIIGEA